MTRQGILTDIQRFSLQDGPGIRTSVFLKGCNMRCGWCHNPETISPQPVELFYPEKCIHCGHCREICHARARVISGREVSVSEVMKEIIQDKPYYSSSGGGVTLTGGEVFCQRDFALNIAEACAEQGIATAIETNLSFPWDEMVKLIDMSEIVMCDLKLYDSRLHRDHTGISNLRILENIRNLDRSGRPYILRTPLIPGVTDTDDNIAKIASFVSELAPLRWELLNFNPLGKSKYQAMGVDYRYANAQPLDETGIRHITAIAMQSGKEVSVA